MTEDYTLIRVGGHDTGIIGLAEAMSAARERFGPSNDTPAIDFLLERLRGCNYIPQTARDAYAQALRRQYRRFLGMALEDAPAEDGALLIQVLGAGCAQCDGLEREVMGVLGELGLQNVNLEHVRDMQAIAKMGIMGVPALVVAGEVKCSGSVPPRRRIRQWLEPYVSQCATPKEST